MRCIWRGLRVLSPVCVETHQRQKSSLKTAPRGSCLQPSVMHRAPCVRMKCCIVNQVSSVTLLIPPTPPATSKFVVARGPSFCSVVVVAHSVLERIARQLALQQGEPCTTPTPAGATHATAVASLRRAHLWDLEAPKPCMDSLTTDLLLAAAQAPHASYLRRR